MSLNLAVVIRADAQSLKSEITAAKAEVETLGKSAATSSAGIAQMEASLLGTAAAAGGLSSTKVAIDGIGSSAAATSTSLARIDTGLASVVTGTVRLSGAAREAANANRDLVASIERATGVSKGDSGRDRAADIEAYGKALDDIRAKYDPLFAAERQHAAALKDIQTAQSVGAITAEHASAEIERQTAAHSKQTAELARVANNTGLAAHQVSNLRSQMIDIGTMYSMGASPFQILSSQAGQVYEALAGGRGVKASLAAIGTSILSLATPVNLTIAGLTAAGAAAIYFATKGEKIVPLADAMESYRDAVGAVGDAYGIATAKAAEFEKKSAGVAAFNLRASRSQLELSARASLNDNFKPGLMTDLFGSPVYQQGLGENGKVLTEVAKQFKAFEKPVLDLVDGLEKGTARADVFVDAVAKIANIDPANKELQKAAKQLIDLAGAAADAQRQMAGLGPAFAKAAQDAKRFNELGADLGQFLPDRRTDAQKIEQTYQQMMRLAKTEADVTRAQDLRRLSLEELTKQETNRRAGYELDIRSVTAKTAAQKAEIAAERERLAVANENIPAAEKEQRIAEARSLALAQSSHEWSEATRQRIEGGKAQVDQTNLEISLIGKSAAEAARLRAEYELMAAAKKAAADAGEVVSPEEIATIKAQAAAIGDATAAMEKLNFQRDLQFRVSQAGRSPQEQRIAEEVRSYGEDIETANGKAMAAQLRYVSSVEKTAKELADLRDVGKNTFFDIVDAIGSSKDGAEALIGVFGSLGKQLASLGAQKVFDKLFGDGSSKDIASSISIPQVSGGSQTSFAAPIGAVARASLPPLVTGEGFSESRASTVASKSVPAQVWNFFASKGLASHQIAGIMGNARAESAFNISAAGDGGKALGLFQWNDRGSAMKAAVGADWKNDLQGQLDFAWKELQTSESRAYRALLQAKDVTQATEAFLGFERPSGYTSGVRNSHNYSGRVSYAQDAYRTYANGNGGEVASSTSDTRVLSRGVSDGMVDANRKISAENYQNGKFDPGTPSNPSGSKSGATLGNGLTVAGAGLGSFFNGMQSGSPLGGGLSGAFSGYEAGGAISSLLNVSSGMGSAIGSVGGAVLGIIGGIIGARKQREAAHRKSAAEWDAVRPQYESFDRSLSGEGNGNLRESINSMWSQLSGFMEKGGAAWKYGSGNSTALFNETGRKMFEKWGKEIEEFRSSFNTVISDLVSGQGIQGAFVTARQKVKELDEQIKKFEDDVKIAYGSTDYGMPVSAAQIENERATADLRATQERRARDAASEYALSLLYTNSVVSDARKAIDSYRGTAAGLVPVLERLGKSSEEAASLVQGRLTLAIGSIRDTLQSELSDEVTSLQGKGYLLSVRDLFKEIQAQSADLSYAGGDTSNVGLKLKLRAQEIVDSADLTGTAFADLIQRFPQLAGVVVEAGSSISRTAKEIADSKLSLSDRLFESGNDNSTESGALARFDRYAQRERETELKSGGENMIELERTLAAERLAIVRSYREKEVEEAKRLRDDAVSFFDGLKKSLSSYLDGLKTGSSSPLSNEGRLAEAQKQFDTQYAKALSGDRDAAQGISGYAQAAIEASRAFNASGAGYQQTYANITEKLEKLPQTVSAEAFIEKAVRETGAATVNALSVMRDTLSAAFAGAPAASANALSVYFAELDRSLDGLLSYDELRTGLAGIATDDQLKQVIQVLDTNGDGQLSQLELLRANTQTQTEQDQRLSQSQLSQLQTSAYYVGGILQVIESGQHTQLDNIFNQLAAMHRTAIGSDYSLWRIASNTMAANNKIGAAAYMTGGYTGDGAVTEVAGLVHGREFVAHAGATSRYRKELEAMNAGTFEATVAPMPILAMQGPGAPGTANDNREIVAELRELRRTMDRIAERQDKLARENTQAIVDPLEAAADQARLDAASGRIGQIFARTRG